MDSNFQIIEHVLHQAKSLALNVQFLQLVFNLVLRLISIKQRNNSYNENTMQLFSSLKGSLANFYIRFSTARLKESI